MTPWVTPWVSLWVVFAASLVLLMQAGFAALEAGLARPKNAAHLATTRLTTVLVTILVFWVAGYALLYGASTGGLVGHTGFFLGGKVDSQPGELVLFCLQIVFAATSASIFVGALGERLRFEAFLCLVVAFTGLLYPVFGHWAWAGVAAGQPAGWLGRAGFVDFAGATVVHALGGWAALAALLVVGNRTGRYTRSGKPVVLAGSSVPLATLGLFLVWLGGLAWMGGSSLQATTSAPRIILATIVATASAGATVIGVGLVRRGAPEVRAVLRAVLAGLVAISGVGHAVDTPQALVIGAVAGVLLLIVDGLLERRRIDDAAGAVAVHLAGGVWGTLAVAFLGDATRLGTGLSLPAQLLVQLEGSAAAAAWGFGGGLLFCRALALVTPLRVSPDEEFVGLDVSEHQAATERMGVLDALEETARHETPFVSGEPFTELAYLSYATEGEGLITSANATASAIFGYDEGEFRRVPITALFAPIRDEPLDLDSLQASLDAAPRELLGLRRTGEDFPMEVALGAELGAIVIKDITARKKSEAGRTRTTEAIRGRLDRELEESAISASYRKTGDHDFTGGDLALLVPPGADWFGAHAGGDGRAITLYAGDLVAQASSTSALLSGVLASGGYETDFTHGLLLGDGRYPPERQVRNLAEVLNRIVSREGRGEVMLAMTFVHVDLGTGNAIIVNAGRRAPTLLKSGRTLRELGGGGAPLGYATDTELQVSQVAFGPGDLVVMTGDGLVETFSPDGSVLRAGELKKRVLGRQTPRDVLGEVVACGRAVWKGVHDQHAVLVFRWKPPLG